MTLSINQTKICTTTIICSLHLIWLVIILLPTQHYDVASWRSLLVAFRGIGTHVLGSKLSWYQILQASVRVTWLCCWVPNPPGTKFSCILLGIKTDYILA